MVADSRRDDVQVFVITFHKFRAQLSSVGFLGKDIWLLSKHVDGKKNSSNSSSNKHIKRSKSKNS